MIVTTEKPALMNPNLENDEALESCRSVLATARKMLDDNPLFCPENRRGELCSDIIAMLKNESPKTTIGVLGNTGVGKVRDLFSLGSALFLLVTSNRLETCSLLF